MAQGLQRRAGPFEGRGEHEPERGLHLGIGVELEATVGPIDQTHWRRERQVAATGLVEQAATQARLEDMQLGLAHRPLQAKQKSVVEARRIIDRILVEQEGGGDGAQLHQLGLSRRAGQPRDLQPHDDILARRDLADQTLEAVLASHLGAGAAEIAVDDLDPLDRPADSY